MNERDIFVAALQKETAAERSAYLDQACTSDPDLRRRVEVLLQAHESAGSFLQRPAVEESPTGAFLSDASVDSAGEVAGSWIGPYKLLEQIGEGGMGVVWMAEQREPLRRLVAVKVVKPGMDSRQVLARFEAERQALALMDHPNIAKVLDAGATATGRPYFVMELVKGEPITRYCDIHRLSPRERLELVVPVCQAVQHAHQKGIIHRDLKPSNVLVGSYDGKPVPKVIDFGVAKAVGQQLTERTLFTGFGGIVGTLEYMSPEQAEFNALDIDTRSDVYSLGVLLYELLTGTTPVTQQRVKQTALAEALRLIREEEPPRPSTRLSTSESLASICAQRRTEPVQLAKLVRGELDWIVMKALEKDRNRRYETANGLARDITHYLADEPVEACPPSAGYWLRKFARKHKRGLATAAAIAVLLVAGIVASTAQAVRASRAEQTAREERDRAVAAEAKARAEADTSRAAIDFVLTDLIELIGQPLDDDFWRTLRQVLPRAAKVADRFDQQPATEAKMRIAIGGSYGFLEDYAAAHSHLQRAYELLQGLHGEEHSETLQVLRSLAASHRHQKQYERAEELYLKELDTLVRVRAEDDDDMLWAVMGLATVYRLQGRPERVTTVCSRLIERIRRGHQDRPKEYLAALDKVATNLMSRSEWGKGLEVMTAADGAAAAEEFLREAL